jgi:hypothetical protein
VAQARSVFQLHAERCQISSPDVHLSTLSFRLDELEAAASGRGIKISYIPYIYIYIYTYTYM